MPVPAHLYDGGYSENQRQAAWIIDCALADEVRHRGEARLTDTLAVYLEFYITRALQAAHDDPA